ncbi:hypothetical protein HA49_06365 [Tatumella morbirosei]|uniref:Enoyl reductase (ER) domain-containing protein n=1 Tax=Tatumella morbirosei TaxID=642227 RepID=A0A095TDB8_9GAMM|nr:MDR family oxidoreductase [Tatumella morbirosei]KGD74906.1 hypothetical protein HA49_06365 [Tatumella morbirosei]
MFQAILIEKDEQGYRTTLSQLHESQLPPATVSLNVLYSSLNYKDALAIVNRAPVVRTFPMVPGIDFVGEVTASQHPQWKSGDLAILTGWGVGENHWGGLAEKAAVEGDWLVPVPAALPPVSTMAIGTAGLTAMLCLMALEKQGITPAEGEVLVTGASGGVGSFAVWLLAQAGYQVVASTGRQDDEDYLTGTLGASRTISRDRLNQPGKPLAKEQWAAAIDTVGSHTLSNVLAATVRNGVVAACGMAQGLDLPASVAPFILRGVTLTGVDSVMCPLAQRREAWQRLAEVYDATTFEEIARVIPLAAAIGGADDLLNGQVRGRLIVNCQPSADNASSGQ